MIRRIEDMGIDKGERIREILEEENPEAILYDGMDEALIGVCRRKIFEEKKNGGGTVCLGEALPVAVYSYIKYIEELSKDMSEEDAVEFFDYNVDGLLLGNKQPLILDDTGV